LPGRLQSHGLVMLRIANRGKRDALNVRMTVRMKDHDPEGESGAGLSELATEGWDEAEVRLADLRHGESVYVPLAHVLGTRKYFGRVLMPVAIRWHNPTLDEEESIAVQGMAPEDRWISRGLNVSVGM